MSPASSPAHATPSSDANKGLLIAAWITAILIPIVGLVISIIGKFSKNDSRFMAPLIVSVVLMVLGVVYYTSMM